MMNNSRVLSSSYQTLPLEPKFTDARAKIGSTNTYLKFQLDSQSTAAIAVKEVEETITVKSQNITAIPNVASCNLGLMPRKNQIIWVIDLAAMLQLEPLNGSTQKYNLVTIKNGDFNLGLAVKAIECVVQFDTNVIQPAYDDTELARHLHGYVLRERELLLVLNTSAISTSPVLYKNSGE